MNTKWTMTEDRFPPDGECAVVYLKEVLGFANEHMRATTAYRFDGSWFDFLTGDELTWKPDRWMEAP